MSLNFYFTVWEKYTEDQSMRLLYKALVESVEFHGHHLCVLSQLNFLFWGYAKHKNVLNSNSVTAVKMENNESFVQNIVASVITTEL
jgi:hypothetical protein